MRVGFVCSTQAQAEMFLPVMQAIADSGRHGFFWIALDDLLKRGAGKTLRNNSVPYLTLKGDIGSGRFTELPLPLMYWHLLRGVRRRINDILSDQRPDVLLLGNDRGLIEKHFIRLAKRQGALTVLLQDGLLWQSEVRTFDRRRYANASPGYLLRDCAKEALSRTLCAVGAFHLAPSYMGQGGCDLILVMGQATRRILAARGIEPGRVVVAGQPRYDRVAQEVEPSGVLREKLHLPVDRLLISFLSTDWDRQRQKKLVERLASFAEQRHPQQLYLLVKPHPNTPPEEYEGLLAGNRCAGVIRGAGSLDVLAASDLVITVPSTIIAEAALLRKPLAVLEIAGMGGPSELLGLLPDALPEFDSFDGLLEFVEQFISAESEPGREPPSPRRAEVASELVYLPPEGAARRVADLVLELARGRGQ